jgi:hypothetical protein
MRKPPMQDIPHEEIVGGRLAKPPPLSHQTTSPSRTFRLSNDFLRIQGSFVRDIR